MKTPSQQLIQELNASLPEYIKRVGEFQWKAKTFTLKKHYFSQKLLRCDICKKALILEVYVVTDQNGNDYNVGNECIYSITNKKIRQWFTNYDKKQKNIKKNSELIDQVSEILEDYENDNLPIDISQIGINRLQKMLDRMSEGLDPLEKTVKVARYYIRKIENAST